jgi:pyruvate kinase
MFPAVGAWPCTAMCIQWLTNPRVTNLIVEELLKLLKNRGLIKAGDRVIVTMGDKTGNQGGTNALRFVELGPD